MTTPNTSRLYVAHFVVALEAHWFAPDTDYPPIRVVCAYRVLAHLYYATDAEAAYESVCRQLPGLSDSNHDGEGDLFVMRPVGIHQVEEVFIPGNDLPAALRDMYGVDVGSYDLNDVDAAGVPRVRAKSELNIFRFP